MQLGWEVLAKLFEALAKPLGEAQLDADCCFWRGRRVVAIDGTTFALPVNEELETEGRVRRAAGEMEQGLGEARNEVVDAADDARDTLKH